MSAIFTELELEECPNCGCKLIQFDGDRAMCPSCANEELAAAQRTIEAQAGILEALEAYGVAMPDKYYDLKEGKD